MREGEVPARYRDVVGFRLTVRRVKSNGEKLAAFPDSYMPDDLFKRTDGERMAFERLEKIVEECGKRIEWKEEKDGEQKTVNGIGIEWLEWEIRMRSLAPGFIVTTKRANTVGDNTLDRMRIDGQQAGKRIERPGVGRRLVGRE